MTLEAWILIIACILVFGVLPPFVILSYILFTILLVRNKPDKWARACSAPEDPVTQAMFDEGMAWAAKYKEKSEELSVENDGLKLFGEYFNFGSDRCVIILGGRSESMLYSYYFAEPYRAAGMNVLVIDPRAHGLSEGKYNTVGFRESGDVLAWGRLIHEKYGINHIFLHGICIGSQTALYALTSKDCPDCFDGMCSEGMFRNFSLVFGNHMKERKKAVFPVLYMVMGWLWLHSGKNAVKEGPETRIFLLGKPILFLHSLEDKYSVPEESKKVYRCCRTVCREVWFEHGEHSRIRPVDTEKYDRSIREFLETEVYPKEKI